MMNDLKEARVDSELSMDLLRQKGFIITNSEESATVYLVRLALKDKNDINFQASEFESQSSLKVFIDNFCTITEFDEDKLKFEVFMNEYELFCKMHHFEKVLVDYIVLQRKFGIESRKIPKPMIERDPQYILDSKD